MITKMKIVDNFSFCLSEFNVWMFDSEGKRKRSLNVSAQWHWGFTIKDAHKNGVLFGVHP